MSQDRLYELELNTQPNALVGHKMSVYVVYDSARRFSLAQNQRLSDLCNRSLAVTPEPRTLTLFGSGLLGLVGTLRRKRSA
jgi:hypothetical protein